MRTFPFVLALVACAPADSLQRPSSPSPATIPPSPGVAPAPLFAATEAAPQGQALRVFVEPTQLVGWIAGGKSFAGQSAKIELAGRVEVVTVAPDNTFSIAYRVSKVTEATVRVGGLVQRLTVEPASAVEPTAYFVVDRPAYRPGQKVAFTAFLRKLDQIAAGSAAAIANTRVEVQLVSETRKTTAAKLALVSDATGRIHGEYTFSPGDPLDSYTISIPGYRGSARVTLAEYRKSKVKLDADAAITARAAKLQFRALDFLEAPVPGGHVTFTAQIVRDEEPAHATALDSAQFAFSRALSMPSAQQRLWLSAHPESAGAIHRTGPQVLDEVRGKVTLDATGTGSETVPLRAEYLRGGHRLLVDAVIVEPNGREQRTTRAIPLARSDVRVQLSTPDELVGTGHPISVAVRTVDSNGRDIAPASASLAVLRMDPPAALDPYGYDLAWNGGWNGGGWNANGWNANAWRGGNLVLGRPNGGVPACRYTATGCRSLSRGQRARARRAPVATPADKLATTVAVTGGKAQIALDEPGAYRLVANVVLADGSSTWSELGIAVRERELLPPLVLELDRTEVRQGERITARVQGRHRDGAVLVLVRDARGIQARQRVVLSAGQARIDLPATDTLSYGAVVEAHALVGSDEVFSAQQHLRVVPSKRELTIKTNAKPTYGPGEQVDLEISVDAPGNGSRAVDLVVTAYDQSLHGVAPDRSIHPRDFYLADDRAWSRAALGALRAELGDVTIESIVARARTAAKRKVDADDQEGQAELAEAAQIVQLFDRATAVNAHSVVALLRFAGLSVSSEPYARWSLPIGSDRKAMLQKRVIDLLARDMGNHAFVRVADSVVISDPEMVAVLAGQGGYTPRSMSRMYARGDASGNASFSAGNASFSAAAVNAPAPIDVGNGVDANSMSTVRRDFSDSAFWSSTTQTGADGKARVSFKLPDSLTNWRVVITAVDRDLRVGRHTTSLRTVRDVMVWPMLPRQFTEGDTLTVFATVHNTTNADRDIAVRLATANVDVLSPALVNVRVPRGKNVPVQWSVRAREPGMAKLVMSAVTPGTAPSGQAMQDASEKHIPIVSSSAEQLVTASGFATKPLVVELPDGVDPKTAKLEIAFAPSLAADMVDTLGYLVEYPYGCAEQTMSRFAPAIRVAGILDNLGMQSGPLRAKLPGVVSAGMKRLAELQQPDGGWGWIGSGTTHEMITPYVVWGLVEAERAGYKLPDERVLRRGLERVRSLAEGLGGDAHLADRVYLAYVYAQRHAVPDAMWRSIVSAPDKLSDYAVALALEIAVKRKDTSNADRLATALRSRVQRTGTGAHWRTSKFSRWGEDPFETTAAAMKALVAYDAEDPLVAEAVAFFVATKRGDRWNSTKDTAMILYAMTELLAKKQVARSAGAFVEYALDGGAARRIAFADGLGREVVIEGAQLKRKTTIAFPKASPGTMARAVLRYRKSGRDLAPAAQGLAVERQLFLVDAKGVRVKPLKSGDRVPQGAYVESAVTVVNSDPAAHGQGMRFLLIEDPKPAGAEALPLDDPRFPRVATPWVLREDRESHLAFHHEQVPSTTTARTFLHLEMRGELVIAPAHAELMYQTATRGHSGSFVLRVD